MCKRSRDSDCGMSVENYIHLAICDIDIYCIALPDIAFSIMRGEYKQPEAGTTPYRFAPGLGRAQAATWGRSRREEGGRKSNPLQSDVRTVVCLVRMMMLTTLLP